MITRFKEKMWKIDFLTYKQQCNEIFKTIIN